MLLLLTNISDGVQCLPESGISGLQSRHTVEEDLTREPLSDSTDDTHSLMAASEKYEQEVKVARIFIGLKDGFKKVDATSDTDKQQTILKDLTARMQDVKT